MTATARRLIPGSQLTASAVPYYSAPALTRAVIRSAVVVNTTGGAVTLTVYLVTSGGSPGAGNTVISRSIAAGATDLCPELINQVIEAGGSIQALGLNLTFVASGIEIT